MNQQLYDSNIISESTNNIHHTCYHLTQLQSKLPPANAKIDSQKENNEINNKSKQFLRKDSFIR